MPECSLTYPPLRDGAIINFTTHYLIKEGTKTPAMEISKKSIDEYTEKLRERYSRMTGWRARGKLLDEYIEVTGYERKYAAKVFGEIRRKSSGKSQWDKKAKIKHSASNTA